MLNLGRPKSAPQTSTDAFYSRDRPLREMLAGAECAMIRKALRDCDGHVTNAARQLGLERSHLYKKMKALGIK